MVQQKPKIADLIYGFPQLGGSPAWDDSENQDAQWIEFARLVSGLYQREDFEGITLAFTRVERLLAEGTAHARTWVTGFLQALQEITAWNSSGSEAFLGFLGPNTRHIWETLNAIRFDLDSCSILEAEILMWRVVHKDAHSNSQRHLS